jgi:acyl-CoA reductase-like NAD-dependent aldehyde dehydrogenase
MSTCIARVSPSRVITSKDASVVAGRSSMVVKFHLDQHTGRKIAGSMKLGGGRNPDSQLGPLVSKEQHDRVLGYIERGLREGGEVLAGTLWVNCHHLIDPALPFGGFKQSRIGRE